MPPSTGTVPVKTLQAVKLLVPGPCRAGGGRWVADGASSGAT